MRQSCASITRERRNRSWELMYWAEERSPVQRVMSMQSKDWLRMSRRVEGGARRGGGCGLWRGGGVGCGGVRGRGTMEEYC